MFPERDIANLFWHFVRGRAIDKRTADDRVRGGSLTLDAIDTDRSEIAAALAEDHDTVPVILRDLPQMPWTYPTVQEALIAFLINQAALDQFPYPYEIWLRAVVMIVADAQRDPGWLNVIACDWDPVFFEGKPDDSPAWREPGLEKPHTMTISDDWSCLSRETFDFVRAEYAGRG